MGEREPPRPFLTDARYEALTGGRGVRQERYLLAKHAHIDPVTAGRLPWYWFRGLTAQVLEDITEGEWQEDDDRPPALDEPDGAASAGVVVRKAAPLPPVPPTV